MSTALQLSLSRSRAKVLYRFYERHESLLVGIILGLLSVGSFLFYYHDGLGLAYNDARSHLDIGRRVVEGLKPGIAQLGSVWLPLTHLLMALTIWNDTMWHTGLAGAIQSMIAFVGTGILLLLFLREIGVQLGGRLLAVFLFATNINILYLQSTAMTELMLLFTMTAGSYFFLLWAKTERLPSLIGAAFWIMLSTLVRYDGWFLCLYATVLVAFMVWKKYGWSRAEGTVLFFCTLAGFGIALWFLWNALIFQDPFYFAFGPYSAHTQQDQLQAAGVLATKHNLFLSAKVYWFALVYNTGAFPLFLGSIGAYLLLFSRRIPLWARMSALLLCAPLFFNVLALFLGHSVLFVQGLSGDTWFNVRYGIMLLPAVAIFTGVVFQYAGALRGVLVALLLFVTFFSFTSADAVTIDDARVGSSQKNVSEVSGWLHYHAADEKGFILISAASHDAIIFSSGLPMKRFIHEGTGAYWQEATKIPDRWARWIVMRSYSDDDQTWRLVHTTPGFDRYTKVASYPFADVYELKPEYLSTLITDPILGKQK